MTPLLFVVPMPPNLANARLHWAAKHKARRAYMAQLDELQMVKLVPPPPSRPFTAALVSSRMVLGNRMDHDNAMARHKWLLDWLETRGYVGNDRNLEWDAVPAQIIDRRRESCIELTLRSR